MKVFWLALCSILIAQGTSASYATSTTLSGLVTDPEGIGIENVKISTDEAGTSTDTDPAGQFVLKLQIENPTSIRLHLEKSGYFPQDEIFKLPLDQKIVIELIPTKTRVTRPKLSQSNSSAQPAYRKSEIDAIQTFTSSRNSERLLTIDGLPGVDAKELLLLATKNERSLMWFPCRRGDNALLVSYELGDAAGNRSVAQMELRANQEPESGKREKIEQSAVRETLRSLDAIPRLLVLDNFDEWLTGDGHSLADKSLEGWLGKAVASEHLRIIALSETNPHFSQAIEPLRLRLEVGNLSIVQPIDSSGKTKISPAAAYLRSLLNSGPSDSMLQSIAEHYGGHPFAFRLVAARLNRLKPSQIKGSIRELLATPVSQQLDSAALAKLFDDLYLRLPENEKDLLEFIAMSARPLSSDELSELGKLAKSPFATEGQTTSILEAAENRLHLVASFPLGSPPVTHYLLPGVLKTYIAQRISASKSKSSKIHAAYFHWYETKLTLPSESQPMVRVAGKVSDYEDFSWHSFELAEVSIGTTREGAILTGAQAALVVQDAHSQEHNTRATIAEMRRALPLLEEIDTPKALKLRADCSLALGAALANDESEQWFAQSDSIYTRLGDLNGKRRVSYFRGIEEFYDGHLERSRALLLDALSGPESASHGLDRANSLRAMGEVEARFENFEGAANYLDEASTLYKLNNSRHGYAAALMRYGEMLQGKKDFTGAKIVYEQTIEIARSEGLTWLLAIATNSLATMLLELQQFDSAKIKFDEALHIFEQVEDTLGIANARFGLAYLQAAKADDENSISKRRTALEEMRLVRGLYEDLGETVGLIRTRLVIVSQLNDLGLGSEAASDFLAALLIIDSYPGQRATILETCKGLWLGPNAEKFESEVKEQLRTLLPSDQTKMKRLLNEINRNFNEN